jgi:hypothetical protein
MPISFGRGKNTVDRPAEPTDVVLNAHLVRDVESASKKGFTGALEATDRATGGSARLFFHAGGLYSVSVDGYEPLVLERLLASGVVSSDRAATLRQEAIRAGVLPGVLAVQHGWLQVDTLATVHQEYLLASLGAVLVCDKVKVRPHKDMVTSEYCTLPLPVDPLLESVRVRGHRLATTWPTLAPEGSPARVVLRGTGSAVPANLSLPEFGVLCSAVDGHRTVDEVAAEGGFTRAEAVHLAGLLMAAGVLTIDVDAPPPSPPDRLLVPEAFGTVRGKAAQVGPTAHVEPEVRPESARGSAEESEPEPAPAVILAPMPAPGPAPEPPVAPAVPSPAPTANREVVTSASTIRAGQVGTDRAGTDHVRQMRREVAEVEVAELSEALTEALLTEREAIAHAGAVRARLREAQATLAALDAPEPEELGPS